MSITTQMDNSGLTTHVEQSGTPLNTTALHVCASLPLPAEVAESSVTQWLISSLISIAPGLDLWAGLKPYPSRG